MQRRPARRQPGARRSDGLRSASWRSSRCWWRSASRRSRSGSPPPRRPTSTSSAGSIEEDRIPDDVTIQVLVQCREELIERTYESLRGARRAIVHFYNSTSALQRRVVFGLDRAGIVEIAVRRPALPEARGSTCRDTEILYEYSPESFTGTEPEFALEICEAVMDVIEPTAERPLILNLPGDRRDVHPQRLRRRHRVVRSPRARSGQRRPQRPSAQRPGHRRGGRRARP